MCTSSFSQVLYLGVNLCNAELANLSVKELHAELCRVCHAGNDVAWSAIDQGTLSRIPWHDV